jgi:hypothetical protein
VQVRSLVGKNEKVWGCMVGAMASDQEDGDVSILSLLE